MEEKDFWEELINNKITEIKERPIPDSIDYYIQSQTDAEIIEILEELLKDCELYGNK